MLTPQCPFQLSSNVLEYLKTVFVFYDLTTKNFLKSVHYCLLDQYANGNAYSLCATTFDQAKKNIMQLKHDDFEVMRRLPSFRPYIESMMTEPAKVIAMFKDDEFFRVQLIGLIQTIYAYFYKFYGYVRLLWTLVKDLPNSPLGKRLSDVYMYCHSSEKSVTTTEEFAKCWQVLGMMSKDEFIKLLEKCCKTLEDYEDTFCNEHDAEIDDKVKKETFNSFDVTCTQLSTFITELTQDRQSKEPQPLQMPNAEAFKSRTLYYQKMKEMQKQAKSEASDTIQNVLKFLRTDIIEKHLPARNNAPPLLELFVYSDYDKVRSHLRGTPRSAIHKALTDPHYYLQVARILMVHSKNHDIHSIFYSLNFLQCKCCAFEGQELRLLPTMPDNSIAYGLLIESGQQVNIYDWMSAFNTIVGQRTIDDDENNDGSIPAEIQYVFETNQIRNYFELLIFRSVYSHLRAKFTRARAELHFMGFTKTSKRKTDHVTRTTW